MLIKYQLELRVLVDFTIYRYRRSQQDTAQTWAELHKKLVRPGPHQIFKISNVTEIFPGHVLCKIFKMPHQNLKGLTRI